DHPMVLRRQQAFGYTTADLKILMAPMAGEGNAAIGSLGNDPSLPAPSARPHLPYRYFKQVFPPVTNPPVGCIRHEIIMSIATPIVPEPNRLGATHKSCDEIKLPSPILKNDELDKLRQLEAVSGRRFKSLTLPTLYRVEGGEKGLEKALDALCKQAST